MSRTSGHLERERESLLEVEFQAGIQKCNLQGELTFFCVDISKEGPLGKHLMVGGNSGTHLCMYIYVNDCWDVKRDISFGGSPSLYIKWLSHKKGRMNEVNLTQI